MTRSTPWLAVCIAAITLCALALIAPVAGETATTTPDPTATVADPTSVGTAESFSGFTLGAGVLAVLAGGAYWYFRR